MSSKQRIQELRIPRTTATRQRSLCGGTVIGDYINEIGERVLTVKVVSVPKPKGVTKPKAKAAAVPHPEQLTDMMAPGVAHG